MGKTNNLHDFLKDLADAIREKTGVSESINPQDFSKQIKAIQGSSNNTSSEENVGYLQLHLDQSYTAFFLLFLSTPIIDFVFSTPEELEEFMQISGNVSMDQLGYGALLEGGMDYLGANIIAVKYSKRKYYGHFYFDSDGTGVWTSGTPLERHKQAYASVGIEFPQELEELMNTSYEEITKEEYEALITYKPE